MEREFVLYDLEFTSWEGCLKNGWNEAENQYREVIQVGAMIVDTETFEPKQKFLACCRPLKNPVLSEYIVNLTGITQQQVDGSLTFPFVLEDFQDFIGGRHIFAYGDDYLILKLNSEYCHIPLMIPAEQATNLKTVLRNEGFPVLDYYSGILSEYYSITPNARAHNALADVETVLRTLQEMRARSEYNSVLKYLSAELDRRCSYDYSTV